MEPLTSSTLFLLWLAGLFSGFVDAIAGGGGIISLPALLATGMPPHLALGTNKLQGTFGSLTAAVNYSRKGLVNLREIPTGVVFTAIGALIGTVTVQVLSPDFLRHIILILLAGVFLYTLFSPELGKLDRLPSMAAPAFFGCAGLVLGFYDGFFGPGTGSFWAIALVMVLGLNLKKATAHTKIFNFTSNVVALGAFFFGHNVVVSAGLLMGAGQMLGAFLGSRLVIQKGTGFVRVFFLVVVAATIVRLAYTTYAAQ
ncbi:TSUP family transporter [uncultured Desulfosarcina sp.]|uniref:TSUP family transporter n=1 Tax=uncultured Desulfosarcina sp. TaxID=218289 RepID=UPI0029C66124|nr:TSUP family transporter [uncultured Desulfosarcina sp.]